MEAEPLDILELLGLKDEWPEELWPGVTKASLDAAFPTASSTDLLLDAIQNTKDRVEEGSACPCCGQLAKIYKRKLNANMVRFLLDLVRFHGEGRLWVHYGDCTFKGRDYSYISHWGLARTVEARSTDVGRTSGMWQPTDKGIRFAKGKIQVPSHAILYNNIVVGWSASSTGVVAALGTHFNYDELMGGI